MIVFKLERERPAYYVEGEGRMFYIKVGQLTIPISHSLLMVACDIIPPIG